MANVVRFLRALASGLQEFQAVRSGEKEGYRLIEDAPTLHQGFTGARLTVDNPWLSAEEAHVIERICGSAVSTFSVVGPTAPGQTFLQSRELLVGSACLVANDEATRETVDKGLLFELARTANRLFAEDTVAEEMWALDLNLVYTRDGLDLLLANEVHAFMDASFTGDLERAVKVSDAVAALGVEKYKGPKDERPVIESQMRRTFAALVLLEMAGTLCAQVSPDLVPHLEDRPIGGGAKSDPFAMPEDDE